MTTLYRHIPSRRICKPVPMRHDAGIPGGLHLAAGLTMIEWCDRPGDAIRGILGVPSDEIEPLDGQGCPPDAHLEEFRPVVAEAKVWPSTGLEFDSNQMVNEDPASRP